MNKTDLLKIIKYEKKIYEDEIYYSDDSLIAHLKNEAPYRIFKWQKLSRYTDYYHLRMYKKKGFSKFLSKIQYLYYIRKKQKLGEKLGLEIGTENIGKGLVIFHYNNVVNACSVIGENCHLHGTNVIGNNGITSDAPILGNNVMVGAGAQIIGKVIIADNIKIAAGAVVVSSFLEPGITIGGVPARKLR